MVNSFVIPRRETFESEMGDMTDAHLHCGLRVDVTVTHDGGSGEVQLVTVW